MGFRAGILQNGMNFVIDVVLCSAFSYLVCVLRGLSCGIQSASQYLIVVRIFAVVSVLFTESSLLVFSCHDTSRRYRFARFIMLDCWQVISTTLRLVSNLILSISTTRKHLCFFLRRAYVYYHTMRILSSKNGVIVYSLMRFRPPSSFIAFFSPLLSAMIPWRFDSL